MEGQLIVILAALLVLMEIDYGKCKDWIKTKVGICVSERI